MFCMFGSLEEDAWRRDFSMNALYYSPEEQTIIDFVGGFSALVQKGFTRGDAALIEAIPEAISATSRVCSSVNVASTRAGINMDAVVRMADVLLAVSKMTGEHDSIGCAKIVVFCNVPEDNPFMAGAMHGSGEPEVSVNVAISGPGVVRSAVDQRLVQVGLSRVAGARIGTCSKGMLQRLGVAIALVLSMQVRLPSPMKIFLKERSYIILLPSHMVYG